MRSISAFNSLYAICLGLFIPISQLRAEDVQIRSLKQRSIALIGLPKYTDDFLHFQYANPNAPKGGMLKLAGVGSFDSLNQYATKGQPPDYLFTIYDRLMTRSQDEPYTLYPQIAVDVEYPEDFSWVAFNINPAACFHDGHPVTAEDIVFTAKTLKQNGPPFFKRVFQYLSGVEATSSHRVQFDMHESNRTIKSIALLAHLPVLPKHFWQDKNFGQSTMTPPLGSGPMKIARVIPGKSITYQRVEDYWGSNLPVNKGLFNFDTIQIDYYRDNHAALEAFAAGAYDLRIEGDARNWHQKYNFPAIQKGDIVKEKLKLKHPHGMNALVFNTRKSLFQNRKVRIALNLLFNFEWINKSLLYSEYQHTNSFYVNSPMASLSPPSTGELKLLQQYKELLPPEILHEVFEQPESDHNGQNRHNKIRALQLLNEAGWQLKHGEIRHTVTNQPMVFELLVSPASSERLFASYRKALAEVGIHMNIKVLDHSLFRKLAQRFDFYMIDWHFWHSSFPGIEQQHSWSSQAANEQGSNNLAGVKDPVIDNLLTLFNHVNHYQESIDICKAMDRILLWKNYMIPKWHKDKIFIAYRKNLKHPDIQNLNWLNINLWWQGTNTVSVAGKP